MKLKNYLKDIKLAWKIAVIQAVRKVNSNITISMKMCLKNGKNVEIKYASAKMYYNARSKKKTTNFACFNEVSKEIIKRYHENIK